MDERLRSFRQLKHRVAQELRLLNSLSENVRNAPDPLSLVTAKTSYESQARKLKDYRAKLDAYGGGTIVHIHGILFDEENQTHKGFDCYLHCVNEEDAKEVFESQVIPQKQVIRETVKYTTINLKSLLTN